MSKYEHSEAMHNLESPSQIVPVILEIIKPKSVVDFGCGIGTFLHVFKKNGVSEVMGLDGKWVNKELLHKYISESEFKEVNLEESISLEKKYDLAISLEVAEHLSEKSAITFVKNLARCADKVVFSAAIPNQGGQNHINEQPLTYWEKLFNDEGYEMIDCLRPIFWDNTKVFSWYKQNMVLFVRKGVSQEIPKTTSFPKNIVHPELLEIRAADSIRINNPSIGLSLKLLIKSILGEKVIKLFRK